MGRVDPRWLLHHAPECRLAEAESVPGAALTAEWYQGLTCAKEHDPKFLEREQKMYPPMTNLGQHLLFNFQSLVSIRESIIESKCKKWAKASEFSKILWSWELEFAKFSSYKTFLMQLLGKPD